MAKLTIKFAFDPIDPITIDGLDRGDIERVLSMFGREPPAYCDTSYPPRHFDVISKEQNGGKYAPRSQKRIKGPVQVYRT